MNMDKLHDLKMRLAILVSIVNDFDVETEQQDEYIDYMHMHLVDAERYLSYLISEVEQ